MGSLHLLDEHRQQRCSHRNAIPYFDPVIAANLTAFQVRWQFPRHEGRCPDCKKSLICYASWIHASAGGWV